jgi:aminoglycoside 2''-phosphotransferase
MQEPDWKTIELENPGLLISTVRYLGEGWTSRAYLVNTELVFRFPKRPADWPELQREIAFLAFAAEQLPLSVPEYLQVVPDSATAAAGYAVYRYLRGQELKLRSLAHERHAAIADSLAEFLLTLHGLRPDPELNSLLPAEDARSLAEDYFARADREIVPKLEQTEARDLRKLFEEYLNDSRSFLFRPSVIHADLSGEHILVEDGSVVGVIDFGDVSWGDPDYDFSYLFVDFGHSFVLDVARRYGHSDLKGLENKLRYFAVVDQIGTILDGAGRALEGQEEAAWGRLTTLLRNDASSPNTRAR